MPRRRLLLTLLAFAACEHTPTELDPGGGLLVTDAGAYVARHERGTGGYAEYGFTVVARFTNTTSRTLYLENCFPDAKGPTFGVALVDPPADAFGSAYSPFWACVGVDLAHMVVVRPGATRVDTIHVVGPTAVDGITQRPLGAFDGRMRLVYEVMTG